jgi:ribose 5-phosphate isomerase
MAGQVAGCTAKLRENKDGSPYVTDNENYIVRISSPPLYVCVVTDTDDAVKGCIGMTV